MAIIREFNLYLTAGKSIPLVINVNQFDSGEQWVFTIYKEDGTQYIPSTGAIVGIKSDNLGIINSGTVDENGRVIITETQQMTASVGKAVFELTLDSGTHGTANFVVMVEEKPGNNADLSDSDLSLIQEALNAVSPLPTGGTVGQVLTKTANGSTWSDAGTPTQEQVADAVSDWADEHITVSTGVVIDTSLAVAGAAADSKKVGDEITDLKSAIEHGGITADIKAALLDIAKHAWYNTGDSQKYYDNLYDALYAVTALSISQTSISMVGAGNTVQLSATVVPAEAIVTWSSSDTSVATVDQTGLVTSVSLGSAIITASAGRLSATCSVLVSQASVSSISAVLSADDHFFFVGDSLDSFKDYLTVTATWSNSATSIVASEDYSINGSTATAGEQTFTVSYGGKSATFTATIEPTELTDWVNGYLNSSNGTVGNSRAGWVSGYRAVNPSTTYIITDVDETLTKVDGHRFTADKTSAGRITFTKSGYTWTFTTQETTRYVRIAIEDGTNPMPASSYENLTMEEA